MLLKKHVLTGAIEDISVPCGRIAQLGSCGKHFVFTMITLTQVTEAQAPFRSISVTSLDRYCAVGHNHLSPLLHPHHLEHEIPFKEFSRYFWIFLLRLEPTII